MKQIIKHCLFLFLALSALIVNAQTRSESKLSFKGATYDIFIIKADTHSLSKLNLLQNTGNQKHVDFVNQNTTAGDSDFFLINAGVSDQTCKQEGLFIKEGQEISPLNLNDGTTNFYLKPNGVLLITKDGKAMITESTAVSSIRNIEMAVQSGPMLLNGGSYNPQINEGSKNRNIRCGVGIYKNSEETFLVFAIANEPVNFFDFAALFKARFGCTNALCLESGGCAMYSPFIGRQNNTDNSVICNYIIYRH